MKKGTAEDDAAARPGDFLVTRPVQSQFEFPGAVTAVDNMGVAIDQAWRDQVTLAIDDFAASLERVGGYIGGAPDPGDATILDRDRSVIEQTKGSRG